MTTLSLTTRIDEAEMSVRTRNLLCKKFGEDVTFWEIRHTDRIALKSYLGAKGMKEFEEVIWAAGQGTLDAPHPGLVKTLRDEFALAALPALLARHRADLSWTEVAPTAYSVADAMILARAK